MWNNEWKKGVDYPEWGDNEVYKAREFYCSKVKDEEKCINV